MTRNDDAQELEMDAENLFQEELFSDRKAGTLRRLTPVTAEGAVDPNRPVLYIGQAQLLTPVGTIPLSFEIPAGTLREAVDGFGPAAEKAVENAVEELKEMQRQASSSIVIPEMGPGGLGGPGGIPGGGKIQIP